MYRFLLKNVTNLHEYEELIKVFLRPEEFELFEDEAPSDALVFEGEADKNVLKKKLYKYLENETGKSPKWGIITGIRPVKLAGEIAKGFDGDFGKAREKLLDYYCVSEEKADTAIEICWYQQQTIGEPDRDSIGIYIGIPFCPTRCLYCSFTSNQVPDSEIERYLKALHKEIDYAGNELKNSANFVESIYVGGGTPTTLNPEQINELVLHAQDAFGNDMLKEFTLEAGRPDTITAEKLQAALDGGVGRISINPQTMSDRTLELIGRKHTADEIRKAFTIAKEVGIPIVNADIIAGLPEETIEDFRYTLDEVVSLEPENITVHTLAIKRASRLAGVDKNYHYDHAEIVKEMLEAAEQKMQEHGYRPYYLYRQKQMAGALENIGYCKPGTEGLYNVRIMEENQTIIALGAGGISKMCFPEENRHERVPNVSNYEIYIDRIDEMIQRKKDGIIFRRK